MTITHSADSDTNVALSFQPFDLRSSYLHDAATVYARTWRKEPIGAVAFFRRQATYPHFLGRVALLGGEVVAMGFGTRSEPGQWWHDKVAQQVGVDHPALQDAWVLVELAVLPEYRGRGIGGRLHDLLLRTQPYPRVLLSTEVKNTRARAMYERRGWQYLHPGFCFSPGDNPFVVMHRETPHDWSEDEPG